MGVQAIDVFKPQFSAIKPNSSLAPEQFVSSKLMLSFYSQRARKHHDKLCTRGAGAVAVLTVDTNSRLGYRDFVVVGVAQSSNSAPAVTHLHASINGHVVFRPMPIEPNHVSDHCLNIVRR